MLVPQEYLSFCHLLGRLGWFSAGTDGLSAVNAPLVMISYWTIALSLRAFICYNVQEDRARERGYNEQVLPRGVTQKCNYQEGLGYQVLLRMRCYGRVCAVNEEEVYKGGIQTNMCHNYVSDTTSIHPLIHQMKQKDLFNHSRLFNNLTPFTSYLRESYPIPLSLPLVSQLRTSKAFNTCSLPLQTHFRIRDVVTPSLKYVVTPRIFPSKSVAQGITFYFFIPLTHKLNLMPIIYEIMLFFLFHFRPSQEVRGFQSFIIYILYQFYNHFVLEMRTMISEKLFGYTKPGDNMIEYEE